MWPFSNGFQISQKICCISSIRNILYWVMIQDQTSIRSMTRRRIAARSTKAEKISRNVDGHFSAVSPKRRLDASLSHPSALSFLTRLRVCSYVRFVSPSVTPCSLRCPRDSSRQLLVIYLQHGPKGAPGRAPSSGLQASRVPTGLGPLWRTMSRIRDYKASSFSSVSSIFFPSLPLSLSLSSHAFHWSRLPARSFSLFPIPPALYFRISRETGSSRSSSAAFEQLPDPSRDFIRTMRRKEFKSTKRIYVYTNKYDIYKSIY